MEYFTKSRLDELLKKEARLDLILTLYKSSDFGFQIIELLDAMYKIQYETEVKNDAE